MTRLQDSLAQNGFPLHPQTREGSEAARADPAMPFTSIEDSAPIQISHPKLIVLRKILQSTPFPQTLCFQTADPALLSWWSFPDKGKQQSFVLPLLRRTSSIPSIHHALLRWTSTISSTHALLQLLSLPSLSGCDVRSMSAKRTRSVRRIEHVVWGAGVVRILQVFCRAADWAKDISVPASGEGDNGLEIHVNGRMRNSCAPL